MTKNYHSNGKLLLTGEYLVLDKARALAMPTRYGQSMTVSDRDDDLLHWTSLDFKGNAWFIADFELNDQGFFTGLTTEADTAVNIQLLKLLNSCCSLNPNFGEQAQGNNVITTLEFPRDWGLGSSSTLINNLAQWAEINPFLLLEAGFGGSGYDIACAKRDTPIYYQRSAISWEPSVKSLPPFNWNFEDRLFFVHLNQKMDSKKAIAHYKAGSKPDLVTVQAISDLSIKTYEAASLSDFEATLTEHERIIGELLGLEPIQQALFADYEGGIVKSLGGWGGDFALVSGRENDMEYFRDKGYITIIPFSEMKKPLEA